MHHFPLDFLTSTTLASQVVYWASPTKPACFSLSASAIVACLLLSPSFLFFWETGFVFGKTDNRWAAILGWTRGRSAADQAKRLAFYLSTCSMWRSFPSGREVPIWKKWSYCSSGSSLVSPMGSSRASEFILGSKSLPARMVRARDYSMLWVVRGGCGSFRLAM